MNKTQLSELISKASMENGIEYRLLLALCKTESSLNPYAVRKEPNWKWWNKVEERAEMVGCTYQTMKSMYSTSYGMTQIMGATYYDHGGKNYATELCDPEIALQYCCKILKNIMMEYRTPMEIYAIYNAGVLKFKDDGRLINQTNVNHFLYQYTKAEKLPSHL